MKAGQPLITLDDTNGLNWSDMTDAQRQASAVRFRHISFDGANVTAAVPSVLQFGQPSVRINTPPAIAGELQFGTAAFGPPIAAPGIAATGLLCVIFAWNEYFYAIQLNFANASTMPQWVIGNVSTRGNFLAKLSAASVLACLPVVIAGWAAQKKMIRGLSMGAIK